MDAITELFNCCFYSIMCCAVCNEQKNPISYEPPKIIENPRLVLNDPQDKR